MISVFITSFFVSNVSRKNIFLFALIFVIIGSFIVVISSSIIMGTVGFFTTGLGTEILIRCSIPIISEITY